MYIGSLDRLASRRVMKTAKGMRAQKEKEMRCRVGGFGRGRGGRKRTGISGERGGR
jgi:hypothetical protein